MRSSTTSTSRDPSEHTVGQFAIVREALARHANIQVHLGKTRAWNSAGEEPPGLLEVLPPQDPENPCWTGNWALPAAQQGVVVLGSPVGSRDFIAAKLAQRLQEQDRLLSRIPRMPELQSANGTPPSTRAAEQAARFLRSEGFSAPTWARLLEEDTAAPAPRTTRSAPGARPGWQRAASKALDKRALEMLFNDIDPTSRALLLSQAGDAASCAFTALPTSADTSLGLRASWRASPQSRPL